MKSSPCAIVASLLVALVVSCATAEDAVSPTDDVYTADRAIDPIDQQAAVDELDLSAEDRAALDLFGQQCGAVVCTGATHCCNASCSKCVPFGMECTQEACLVGDPDTE